MNPHVKAVKITQETGEMLEKQGVGERLALVTGESIALVRAVIGESVAPVGAVIGESVAPVGAVTGAHVALVGVVTEELGMTAVVLGVIIPTARRIASDSSLDCAC